MSQSSPVNLAACNNERDDDGDVAHKDHKNRKGVRVKVPGVIHYSFWCRYWYLVPNFNAQLHYEET